MKTRINFEKVLGLKHNIGGYVSLISDEKAVRKQEKDGHYTYSFHTKSVFRYEDNTYEAEDGLYQIIDICKWNNKEGLQWNIYLVVISDGEAYPVAEYLDSPYTLWVKEARSVVKSYFNGEELDLVEITPQPKSENKVSKKWSAMNPPQKSKKEKKSVPEEKVKKEKKDENRPIRPSEKNEISGEKKPKKKGGSGRSQEVEPLKEGQVRLMTFTGMIVGTYPVKRHNSKYIEIDTDKGTLRFSKETKKQVNVTEGKERYANKIEYKLKKKEK